MKKTILLFVLFPALASGQWLSQATGFFDPNRGIDQIVITSPLSAWATAYDGGGGGAIIQEFTHTTDGGDTWIPGTVNTAASDYQWSCIAALDGQTAWSMFFHGTDLLYGYIFKTTDGGQTWTQQGTGDIFVSSTSFANVVYFWDANTGMAMGDPVNNEFEIYTTSDGGTTWNDVDAVNIPDPLSGEFGLTRGHAVGYDGALWFFTNMGRVFKTTDHGQTWNAYTTGIPGLIETIAAKDANTCWVRRLNVMKKTTDGGQSWTTVAPSSGHFFRASLSFIPTTDNALVSTGSNFQNGDFGSSYSLDGGDNWVTIDSAIQHIAVSFFDNLTGWSGGFNLDPYTDGIFKYTGAFVANGLESLDPSFKMNLYPNPSDGLFYFSADVENNKGIQLQVRDGLGRTVFQQAYSDKSQTWLRSIDLRQLSNGVYFLDLENNGNHIVQKLMIH